MASEPFTVFRDALEKTIKIRGLDSKNILSLTTFEQLIELLVKEILQKLFVSFPDLDSVDFTEITRYLLGYFNERLSYEFHISRTYTIETSFFPKTSFKIYSGEPLLLFLIDEKASAAFLKETLQDLTTNFFFVYLNCLLDTINPKELDQAEVSNRIVSEYLANKATLPICLDSLRKVQSIQFPIALSVFTKQMYAKETYGYPTILFDTKQRALQGNHLIEPIEIRKLLICFVYTLSPKLIDCMRMILNNPHVNGLLMLKDQAELKSKYYRKEFFESQVVNLELVFGKLLWDTIKSQRYLVATHLVKLMNGELNCITERQNKTLEIWLKYQVNLQDTQSATNNPLCFSIKEGPLSPQEFTIQSYINTFGWGVSKKLTNTLEKLIETYLSDMSFTYDSIFYFHVPEKVDFLSDKERLRNAFLTYILLVILNMFYSNEHRKNIFAKNPQYSVAAAEAQHESELASFYLSKTAPGMSKLIAPLLYKQALTRKKNAETRMKKGIPTRKQNKNISKVYFDSKSYILTRENIDTYLFSTGDSDQKNKLLEDIKLALFIQLVNKFMMYKTTSNIFLDVIESKEQEEEQAMNASNLPLPVVGTEPRVPKNVPPLPPNNNNWGGARKHKRYSRKN